MSPIERREFLRYTSSLAALGAGAPLALDLAGMSAASAQTATDYKALVCIFLFGGNDSYNTVLATDPSSWSIYNALRSQAPSPIALLKDVAPDPSQPGESVAGLGGVLPIAPRTPQGRSYALHPLLTNVRDLFAAGNVAVVANVGSLVSPTSKSDYANSGFIKPPRLFSHADQTNYWQSMQTAGATSGWGGRMADLLLGQNTGLPTFTAISPSGRALWMAGTKVRQYDVATTGPIALGGKPGQVFGNPAIYNAATSIMGYQDGAQLMQDDIADIFKRSGSAYSAMSAVLPPIAPPFGTSSDQGSDPALQYVNPHTRGNEINPLAKQLQVIGRISQAQAALGMRRQIFYVSMGTFDTHGTQNKQHSIMMAQLNHGLGFFWNVLRATGLQNAVTTFTASDFGRTFTSNGDGTDHGWGGHHFVMGGAVRGGDIYGNFPIYNMPDANQNFTSPDQIVAGVMLPQISVDQYAATFGQWMGASQDDLKSSVLPNLRNFNQTNLGFMAA